MITELVLVTRSTSLYNVIMLRFLYVLPNFLNDEIIFNLATYEKSPKFLRNCPYFDFCHDQQLYADFNSLRKTNLRKLDNCDIQSIFNYYNIPFLDIYTLCKKIIYYCDYIMFFIFIHPLQRNESVRWD